MIKAKIILPHVYLLTFKTRYELCMSFVRIQEFYESASSKFKGKYFTLEDYIDYWSLEHGKDSFTYPSVWNGFNVPSSVFNKWIEIFHELRPRENEVLKSVGELYREEYGSQKDGEYYVIAVHEEKDQAATIKHETAHALYYLHPEYKKMCDKLLKKVPKPQYEKNRNSLLKMGYCKGVMKDELQAYYSVENGMIPTSSDFVENLNAFMEKDI